MDGARKAILLVGHGSRDPEGNARFLDLAAQVAGARPEEIVEPCFIELAEPPIPEGIDRLVARGGRDVAVVPLVLLGAGHAKVEVPGHLDRARARYPFVTFRYGRPLGVHPLLLEILEDRLAAAEGAGEPRDRSETAVLLVGRGSSDPDANGDLFKAGRLLWERRGCRWVECCFIGITRPDLPGGVRRCLALGARRVIVLPYFLFTGVLMKRMQRMLAGIAAGHPGVDFVFAGPDGMGTHPNVIRLVLERADEARGGGVAVNCDACRYRLAAGHDGHHHHHHDRHGDYDDRRDRGDRHDGDRRDRLGHPRAAGGVRGPGGRR